MRDCFNLYEINKSILSLMMSSGDLMSICENFALSPDGGNAEEMLKKIEEIEENLLKVKRNLVSMVDIVDGAYYYLVEFKTKSN